MWPTCRAWAVALANEIVSRCLRSRTAACRRHGAASRCRLRCPETTADAAGHAVLISGVVHAVRGLTPPGAAADQSHGGADCGAHARATGQPTNARAEKPSLGSAAKHLALPAAVFHIVVRVPVAGHGRGPGRDDWALALIDSALVASSTRLQIQTVLLCSFIADFRSRLRSRLAPVRHGMSSTRRGRQLHVCIGQSQRPFDLAIGLRDAFHSVTARHVRGATMEVEFREGAHARLDRR